MISIASAMSAQIDAVQLCSLILQWQFLLPFIIVKSQSIECLIEYLARTAQSYTAAAIFVFL